MNIAVAQSGGPTVAINASLLGVYLESLNNQKIDKIYGIKNGIRGAIDNKFIELNEIIKEENIDVLRNTPAAFLGSCRYMLKSYEEDNEKDNNDYDKIIENFRLHNIGAFFYIGGNDSMDTVDKLSDYVKNKDYDIKIIGIPKTIDNDLVETDHTPGFGSAAKFLATTINEIMEDSRVYDMKSVTIIGIMGRDAGWLTASACVLKSRSKLPMLFYLPEVPFDLDRLIDDIKKAQEKENNIILCVSEGIKDREGNYIASNEEGKTDKFGHKSLDGVSSHLAFLLKSRLDCKIRAIELNVLQRCASHIASKTDIEESELLGRRAVNESLKDKSGIMMTIERVSDSPYEIKIGSISVKECANRVKSFPIEWIEGNDIKEEAIKYFMPLIKGEVSVKFKDGIPVHFTLT